VSISESRAFSVELTPDSPLDVPVHASDTAHITVTPFLRAGCADCWYQSRSDSRDLLYGVRYKSQL
jgi:hypothetical protein